MKLAIEILNREISQRELANQHNHLRKDEVNAELESLRKVLNILSIEDRLINCIKNKTEDLVIARKNLDEYLGDDKFIIKDLKDIVVLLGSQIFFCKQLLNKEFTKI